MKSKIFIIFIIMFIVFFHGCIQYEIDNINKLSPTINEHLKKGNEFYNKAALNSNGYYFESGLESCDKALNEFNLAKSSAKKALEYAINSEDKIFIQYLECTLGEIDAKINATSELKLAIEHFKEGYDTTANSHVYEANELMEKAMEYKRKREEIVKQNPKKFKKA